MYKLMLLFVAVLALVAVASAQVLVYPQTYPSVYTYPSYPYTTYPLSYSPYYSPYTLLRR